MRAEEMPRAEPPYLPTGSGFAEVRHKRWGGVLYVRLDSGETAAISIKSTDTPSLRQIKLAAQYAIGEFRLPKEDPSLAQPGARSVRGRLKPQSTAKEPNSR